MRRRLAHCTDGTARHGTARHGTARHRTAPHRTAPHRTAPHRTAPQGTALHRTAPHRIARITCTHARMHITARCAPPNVEAQIAAIAAQAVQDASADEPELVRRGTRQVVAAVPRHAVTAAAISLQPLPSNGSRKATPDVVVGRATRRAHTPTTPSCTASSIAEARTHIHPPARTHAHLHARTNAHLCHPFMRASTQQARHAHARARTHAHRRVRRYHRACRCWLERSPKMMMPPPALLQLHMQERQSRRCQAASGSRPRTCTRLAASGGHWHTRTQMCTRTCTARHGMARHATACHHAPSHATPRHACTQSRMRVHVHAQVHATPRIALCHTAPHRTAWHRKHTSYSLTHMFRLVALAEITEAAYGEGAKPGEWRQGTIITTCRTSRRQALEPPFSPHMHVCVCEWADGMPNAMANKWACARAPPTCLPGMRMGGWMG